MSRTSSVFNDGYQAGFAGVECSPVDSDLAQKLRSDAERQDPIRPNRLSYEGSSALEQAAAEVLRDALDLVKFQICGPVDDIVAADELSPALKSLLRALTE